MVTGSLSAVIRQRRKRKELREKANEYHRAHKEEDNKRNAARSKYISDHVKEYTKDCRDKPLCGLLRKMLEELRERKSK